MSLSRLSNNDFHAKDVGRGIWHYWHSVGFHSKYREDVISLYHTILIYNKVIRCAQCKEHSNHYIDKTGDDLVSKLKDITLTDTEVIDYFNRWLYQYHNEANLHSGKDPSTFPTYEEVVEFYLNYEMCNEDCGK